MFKDKELKAIVVVDAETKEILGMIDKDNNVVQRNDVLVILDYSDEKDNVIVEKEGKFYWIAENMK